METKRLGVSDLQLKFVGDDMSFAGYASVFGGVDAYGDTIDPKAYDNTLLNRNRPIRLRWNHYGPVIGKWKNMFVDDKGLFVEGQLTPGHSTAMDVYASMKHGAIDGMSIGYIPLKSEQIDDNRRLLKEIELFEISVVEEPADLNATINSVKSALEVASSIREVEAVLRESGGFSRNDACMLVSRIKSLLKGDLLAEEKAKQEIAKLFQIKVTTP
jgi:HK97 family phage prohead protease